MLRDSLSDEGRRGKSPLKKSMLRTVPDTAGDQRGFAQAAYIG